MALSLIDPVLPTASLSWHMVTRFPSTRKLATRRAVCFHDCRVLHDLNRWSWVGRILYRHPLDILYSSPFVLKQPLRLHMMESASIMCKEEKGGDGGSSSEGGWNKRQDPGDAATATAKHGAVLATLLLTGSESGTCGSSLRSPSTPTTHLSPSQFTASGELAVTLWLPGEVYAWRKEG